MIACTVKFLIKIVHPNHPDLPKPPWSPYYAKSGNYGPILMKLWMKVKRRVTCIQYWKELSGPCFWLFLTTPYLPPQPPQKLILSFLVRFGSNFLWNFQILKKNFYLKKSRNILYFHNILLLNIHCNMQIRPKIQTSVTFFSSSVIFPSSSSSWLLLLLLPRHTENFPCLAKSSRIKRRDWTTTQQHLAYFPAPCSLLSM